MKKLLALTACAALGSSAFAGTYLFNSGTVSGGDAGLAAPVTDGPNGPVATPSGQGTVQVATEDASGREKGQFTANGTPLVVNSANWVLNAGWTVPQGVLASNPATGTAPNVVASRWYVGGFLRPSTFGGGTEQYGICGLEYNVTTSDWRLRSDADGVFGGGLSAGSPNYFQLRQTKTIDGGGAGTNTLLVQYAVDFGSFQNFPAGFGNPLLTNFAGAIVDEATDTFGYSSRGYGSQNFKMSITGSSIPDVGAGVDSDGDGLNDELDPFPFDAAYQIDSEPDGMADEWETANFGDTSQDPFDDFDSDFRTNLAEFLAGTDPTQAVPAAGLLGLAGLGAALAALGGGLAFARRRKA